MSAGRLFPTEKRVNCKVAVAGESDRGHREDGTRLHNTRSNRRFLLSETKRTNRRRSFGPLEETSKQIRRFQSRPLVSERSPLMADGDLFCLSQTRTAQGVIRDAQRRPRVGVAPAPFYPSFSSSGFQQLQQTSPPGRLCSALADEATMNRSHHPEEDEEEAMEGFLLILCGKLWLSG